LFDMALTKGRAGPIESELRHAEGRHIPVRLLARRLAQRDEMLVLLGVEDISETRRLQSRLLQTQKMQAIGQLAGGVAHDFNNLLCVIMANAAVLRHTLEEGAAAESPLDHIEQASERAAALTSQLLAFSRQEMIQMQHLDLDVIIRESELLLRRLLDDDISLEVNVDEDIPTVRGDAGQIQQVVMNLVINAREALHVTGGRIEVHLSSTRDATDKPAARIVVSDNGPGIDDEARSRIFQPFFTTKTHGTGLGLATVQEIISGLGGSVDVESAPGLGANFTVTIPAAQETRHPSRELPAFMDIPVEGCVVIVDDEPLVREAAARALEHAGIEFHLAADAHQALAALEKIGDRAAILVTDVVMPVISGRELSARARDLYPGLPVLYMTGYTDDTILRHGVETAEVELLRKPFSPRLLVHAIKKTIARADRSRDVWKSMGTMD
jgi:two-component system, cell cycle sensor histidine kinase and response regulator CckA